MSRIFYIFLFIILVISIDASAGEDYPHYINLSDDNWVLWLDKEAKYLNDSLYLSSTPLVNIPSNQPTIGWDNLGVGAVGTPYLLGIWAPKSKIQFSRFHR